MEKLAKIVLIAFLVLLFFPIAIGLGLGWLVYTKVPNPKIEYALLIVVAIFTFSLNSSWNESLKTQRELAKNQETTKPSISPNPLVAGSEIQLTPTVVLSVVPTKVSLPILDITKFPTPTSFTDKQEVKVTRVIDGDTIDVWLNGKTERVRFIGINTPETVDPRKPVECFGKAASKVTTDALTGQTVWLESDPSQTNRDKYERLLRYVWTDDGVVDFGKVLIATGFAYEYTYEVPYKYQKDYKLAQREAEAGKKGLWADNACITPTPTPKPAAESITNTSTNTGSSQTPVNNGSSYTCDCSKTCTEISTCAEAQYLLNTCGCKQRDADKDGIACDGAPLKCQN